MKRHVNWRNQRGRKALYYEFNKDFTDKLTSKQKMYLEANYGRGVYSSKRYKEVMQELAIIKKDQPNAIDNIDYLKAKRDFVGDRRQFNKVNIDYSKKVEYYDKENDANERLESYVQINDDYVLGWLEVPGYNNSPIKTVRILSMTEFEEFR